MTRVYSKSGDGHANRGMELEQELNQMHRVYKRLKRALVEKTYPRIQPFRGGREVRITGKAGADYVGTLAGGRSVAFDAKDCAERRIDLNRLTDTQIAHLGGVHALHGLAFVLVRFEYRRCYRIPIDCWAYAYRRYCGDEPTDMVDGWKPKNVASICEVDMKPEWAVEGVDWMRGVELWP